MDVCVTFSSSVRVVLPSRSTITVDKPASLAAAASVID